MSAATMRAVVAKGGSELEVAHVPLPEPSPGEVRVRILACGLCGTDLHFHHAGLYAPGTTPGHEMMGEVDVLGDGVSGFARGDRVAIEPLETCGSCVYCRSGRDPICPKAQVLGIHLAGGFAEYVTVASRRLFRLDPGLEPAVAALAEPLAVSVHGVRRGELESGQRVLVLGAGTIGLLTVAAARALGAADIWVSARHPHQAELAASLGATRVLREDEAEASALAALGAEAEIDLVIETVGGAADTLNGACAAVRPGGVVSVVGVFMGNVTFNALAPFLKETKIAWSNCYAHPDRDADFATAVELLGNERGSLEHLVTHRAGLDDIGHAFEMAADKKGGAVKLAVLP